MITIMWHLIEMWCGRVITKDGISHDPARVQGLVEMAKPQTASDLTQLLGAAGWMRGAIPNFAAHEKPLRTCLDEACKAAGARTKAKLKHVRLSDYGWGDEQEAALDDLKTAMLAMVPLHHPDPAKRICLFTDASDGYWSAIVTQLPMDQLAAPFESQQHQLLACLSGTFKGASSNWAVIEKEAFAIVHACRRLDYLLLCPGGFSLFTDHLNLVYVFNPTAVTTVQRYQAAKLARWATTLRAFQYTIEHVAGDLNVWADLLSRWGAPIPPEQRSAPAAHSIRGLFAVGDVLSADKVEWPTLKEIRAAQENAVATGNDTSGKNTTVDRDRNVRVNQTGSVWIPESARDLQLRIMVISHMGHGGHRGRKATRQIVETEFFWSGMQDMINEFVGGCLHCLRADGSVVPRPLGEALHATKRNEVLHFDWVYLEGRYLLVIKDDYSGFCRLVDAALPNI